MGKSDDFRIRFFALHPASVPYISRRLSFNNPQKIFVLHTSSEEQSSEVNSRGSDEPSMGCLFEESHESCEFEGFSPQLRNLLRPQPQNCNLRGEYSIDSSLNDHESKVAESIIGEYFSDSYIRARSAGV